MGGASGEHRARTSFARKYVLVLAGLALGVLLALLGAGLLRPGYRLGPSMGLASGRQAGTGDGQAAPDFTIQLFGGGTFRLTEQRGRAIVLNFWASWCTPCRAEMPYFETTYRAYRDRGVIFVGVAVQDDPEASRALLEELGITYPAGLDEGNEIALRYQLNGLPTTVFITRDGKVARKRTGAMSENELVTFVEEIAR